MSCEGEKRQTLVVVGGFYSEACQFPSTLETFGSGGRAASAIPKDHLEVELITFTDEKHESALQALAAGGNFRVKASRAESLIHFDYLHPLAKPSFYSNQQTPLTSLSINAELVLCFGMMEGQPVVTADKAIYDPQSEAAPNLFSSNGSTAKSLGIVLNSVEARALTGETDLESAAHKLLQLEQAEFVAVKCGVRGALVMTSGRTLLIPSYRTKNVYKIGSGDVFSAAMIYAWAFRGSSPFEAAEFASLSTAHYCDTRNLPFSWPARPYQVRMIPASPSKENVYLAGPFFTPAQLWMIEECRRLLLGIGVKVFSPYHSIGLGPADQVARADLQALEQSTVVFAILDDFDSGTIFEIGYARSKKIRVVCVFHGVADERLTMLSGTGCEIFADIASAIYAVIR